MKHFACPVALHPDGAIRRIAVYQHPTHGLKLVKAAAPDAAEAIATAARILYALSTLETRAAIPIGASHDIGPDEIWYFALCRIVLPVREKWQHLHAETSTRLLFSWMPLDTPSTGFDAQDMRAVTWIKSNL